MGGDWNAKHTNWGSRLITPKGRNLLQSITKHNCSYLSTGEPTYWPSDTNKTPDLLDLFVLENIGTNYTHTHTQTEASLDLSSDHTPIIATLSTHVIYKPKTPRMTSPKTDWNAYRNHFNENINLNIKLKQPDDIHDAVSSIKCLIQEAAWKSTAPENLGKDPTNNTPLRIRAFVTEKRTARSRCQRSRNPLDKREYNRLTRQLNGPAGHTERATFETYIARLPKKDHSIWKATKQFKRPTLRVPPIMQGDGTWGQTDEE